VRLSNDGPSDGDALLLATRQFAALISAGYFIAGVQIGAYHCLGARVEETWLLGQFAVLGVLGHNFLHLCDVLHVCLVVELLN